MLCNHFLVVNLSSVFTNAMFSNWISNFIVCKILVARTTYFQFRIFITTGLFVTLGSTDSSKRNSSLSNHQFNNRFVIYIHTDAQRQWQTDDENSYLGADSCGLQHQLASWCCPKKKSQALRMLEQDADTQRYCIFFILKTCYYLAPKTNKNIERKLNS